MSSFRCSGKLRTSGPLLLMGDLYHLSQQKTLDRVSTFEAGGVHD